MELKELYKATIKRFEHQISNISNNIYRTHNVEPCQFCDDVFPVRTSRGCLSCRINHAIYGQGGDGGLYRSLTELDRIWFGRFRGRHILRKYRQKRICRKIIQICKDEIIKLEE